MSFMQSWRYTIARWFMLTYGDLFMKKEEELKGAVVLIYANKQDLLGALDDATVTEALELHKIKNRQWYIFKTSAIKGKGAMETPNSSTNSKGVKVDSYDWESNSDSCPSSEDLPSNTFGDNDVDGEREGEGNAIEVTRDRAMPEDSAAV
ncbi:hypothetical protein RHGRI_010648 [Rhododendron griersonianum]|uniref:Uncharacterized protein n=1 Tax=Rhododendron griersonianum TaxID=479676 RepID=A0AAV6KKE8_9ERIC|nr:hypothetical protein RHGRI_010648 [Rhododendron griersonianum]